MEYIVKHNSPQPQSTLGDYFTKQTSDDTVLSKLYVRTYSFPHYREQTALQYVNL